MQIKLVSFPSDSPNKVSAIRALRCITGIGLKEAKDAIEAAMANDPDPITLDMLRGNPAAREQLDILKSLGAEIANTGEVLLDKLRYILREERI